MFVCVCGGGRCSCVSGGGGEGGERRCARASVWCVGSRPCLEACPPPPPLHVRTVRHALPPWSSAPWWPSSSGGRRLHASLPRGPCRCWSTTVSTICICPSPPPAASCVLLHHGTVHHMCRCTAVPLHHCTDAPLHCSSCIPLYHSTVHNVSRCTTMLYMCTDMSRMSIMFTGVQLRFIMRTAVPPCCTCVLICHMFIMCSAAPL